MGEIAICLRELIRRGYELRNINILIGNVGKEHLHMLLTCPPSLSPSKIVQYIKRRSSRLVQD